MTLKQYRKRNGLTQVELAKALGVSVQTIRLWECEVSEPTPENQAKIDALLNDKKE